MIWKCSVLNNSCCLLSKKFSSDLKSAQWLLEVVTDTNSILFMKMFWTKHWLFIKKKKIMPVKRWHQCYLKNENDIHINCSLLAQSFIQCKKTLLKTELISVVYFLFLHISFNVIWTGTKSEANLRPRLWGESRDTTSLLWHEVNYTRGDN